MARKSPIPVDEELELDKAYWELTGYKFNRKRHPWLLWLLLAATAAAAWYYDLPSVLSEFLN